MNTTELIELLKSVEFGASGRPREISISFNSEGMFFPNPKLNIAGTGDGVAGAELTLELTGEVWLEVAIEAAEFYGKGKEERLISYMKDFVSDLNQLDEPEVLSQDLPVIPKFVADWIEVMKQDERPLYSVMSSLMNKTNHEWGIWKSANKNFSEIVAQAWLYGYKVEEKPKYYIIDKNDEVLWYRDNKGIPKLSGSTLRSVLKSNSKDRYQFTEKEIKDHDERFWPFAVEVAE